MRLESERAREPSRLPDFDRPGAVRAFDEKPKRGHVRRYLRNLTPARAILWCYAIWYLLVLIRYFDANPRIWLTALGLSGIVGLALLMSTRAALGSGSRLEGWGIFRLFLMPFCVSSFAALVKGRGFVLIFPPSWAENIVGVCACAIFVAVTLALRRGER